MHLSTCTAKNLFSGSMIFLMTCASRHLINNLLTKYNKKSSLILIFGLIGMVQVNGQDTTSFITSWVTTSPNDDINLTVDGAYSYNYDVDWDNDGIFDSLGLTGPVAHVYASADTHTLRIRGTYPHITINSSPDKSKLISVDQWGTQQWQTMASSFRGCTNMHVLATDAPDLSQVTDLSNMFRECIAFNESINHWDVSNITDMSKMFTDAESFDQPLDNWDVSDVTSMQWLFYGGTDFNQNINNWDVGNTTNMGLMFNNATAFNQPLDQWNTEKVTNMNRMFNLAESFDQDLGKLGYQHGPQ